MGGWRGACARVISVSLSDSQTPYKDVYEMLFKIQSSLELTRQFSEDQIRRATAAG